MSNSLLTIGMITNEALAVLENSLTFTKQVNREYDDQFAKKGAKIGDTVNVRKPVRYVGRRTAGLQVENTVESSVPVTLNNQYGCDVSFTSAELALSIDEFSNRILKPAIATVANMIDYDGLQQFKNIYNNVGVAGVTPSALLTYLQAGVKLDNEAAPNDGERAIVINPIAQATIVDNLKGLFNSTSEITRQYMEGTMGKTAGFKWSMDQNVGVQTTGTYAALASGTGTAVTVTTAISTGSSVVTGGWTSGDQLNAGDTFHIAGVFAVNPQNRQSTGQLRSFVVLANTGGASGGGALTITFAPAVVFSGQYQNVTSATGTVAANAVLTVEAASAIVTPQNLAFHKDAFTFATADLQLPGGVDMAKRVTSKKLGMSMRLVRAYDINADRFPCRLDLLGGWATLRPELASRIQG